MRSENSGNVAVESAGFPDVVDAPSIACPAIRGASGPDRYLSALFDQVFAFLLAFAVAAAGGDDRRSAWTGVAAVSVFVLYFLLSEGLFASTLGKVMFGLRVVDLRGRPCGFSRAFVRTLARFVEANPILLGGLPAAAMIVLTRRHQRLGDLVAGTVVARRAELDYGDE